MWFAEGIAVPEIVPGSPLLSSTGQVLLNALGNDCLLTLSVEDACRFLQFCHHKALQAALQSPNKTACLSLLQADVCLGADRFMWDFPFRYTCAILWL